MVKKIILSVVVVLAVFAVVAAMQPDEFKVTRSAAINATPAEIFAYVNNQHKWEMWSPWAKIDPNATFTYEGPEAGVGATARWLGNNDIGEGSSIIVESRPDDYIKFQLHFVRPMEGVNEAEFTFKPEGGQTLVTWIMQGKKNFIAKAIGLVMNCEKMVGDEFEKGLASLRKIVEVK